ncbi:chemotaxis protein CheW [Sporolactobacillus sp. CPB3-1]|uniref:Chemotaxis protein CheW n=1 Tax=Sporolactobacillus mangiferae TaxID=2940498 RepID=A0ABT0M8A0_9BACL|nr:chemotaxis protein CheW [Sporolactobacillus mangiferae]MCL1630863.1 chemotaxis protein CheW [Sporolactobacillus mangiferae]
MAEHENSIKVILFEMNNETYGVPVDQVLSIEKVDAITRLPNAASFVKGVMNLRGLIIPVVDVRDRLQMGKSEITEESRIIVVDTDEMKVGLLVDLSKEVTDIQESSIEPAPAMVGGPSAGYLKGVVQIDENKLLLLLNLDRVLSHEDVDDLRSLEV